MSMTQLRSVVAGGLLALGLLLPLASTAGAAEGAGAAAPVAAASAPDEKSSATPLVVAAAETAPHNSAATWRQVRQGEAGFTTVRGPETGVLIQSEGMTWRALRNGPITLYGGLLVLLVAAAILTFYKIKGPLKLHDAPTGRLIQRFTTFERVVHWGTAGTFVVLAVTGLALLFGKHVLVPVIGHDLFGYLMILGKNVHNYVGPLFLVFTLLMIGAYLRDNVWHNCDMLWIRKAGGLLTGEHVPSGRFNFGEKTWFWIGVTFLGLTVGISGLLLDFPNFGQTRADMHLFHLVHVIAALLVILLAFGHIYMGTLGAEGAYQSMKTGYVDETWAREHHEHWYNDVKAGNGHPLG